LDLGRLHGEIEMTEDLDDDFMQFLIDQLNQGYSEYKKNHPDFARVVEEEEHKLKGNYQRKEKSFTHNSVVTKRTTCEGCGEWLEGYDMCS
jgi:hypothetical protein